MRLITRNWAGFGLIFGLPVLKLGIGIPVTVLSAIALSAPIFAQAPPSLPTLLAQPSDDTLSAPLDEEIHTPEPKTPQNNRSTPDNRSTTHVIELNLPDLLNIVVQGNRGLQNQVLDRIVQQNALTEAESIFNPTVTPTLSIEAQGDLQNGGLGSNSDTSTTERLGITSTLKTPIGTDITLSVDPINESSWGTLSISQPLLRGAGQAVNQAPIQQARLAESNNALNLKQQVIDTITDSIQRYTNLVSSQETVIIQAQALERRRQELERLEALFQVGRLARVELINSEQLIASAERSLQDARNQLSRANTDLLTLIGSEQVVQFVAPKDAISQLFEAAALQVNRFDLNQLIAQAYEIRTDYQQAKANLESKDLDLLLARDAQRWGLNWQSNASFNDGTTPVTTSLQLTRTFGNSSLENRVQNTQISILQQQNEFTQLTENIRNEITDRFGDVNSQLAQVNAAQRETEAAQLRLEATQARFRLGRDNINQLEINRSEADLVDAQNAELQARIGFINSIAELERAVGTTLETWQPVVDFSPVLATEETTEETNEETNEETTDSTD